MMHTINRFVKFDSSIQLIIVIPEKLHEKWKQLCNQHHFKIPHKVVKGGKTRFYSVKNGLQLIKEKGIIGIHDAVRPLVSSATIKRCFEVAQQQGNAVPAIELTESIRKIEGLVNVSVNRSNIRIIQTPQVFKSEQIIEAYKQNYQPEFTDDANVLEKAGHSINLVEGNTENIKITTPNDLDLADFLLKKINHLK